MTSILPDQNGPICVTTYSNQCQSCEVSVVSKIIEIKYGKREEKPAPLAVPYYQIPFQALMRPNVNERRHSPGVETRNPKRP